MTQKVIPGGKTPILRNFVFTVNISMICEKLRFIVASKYDSKTKFAIKLFGLS